jgi:hypothetical protein
MYVYEGKSPLTATKSMRRVKNDFDFFLVMNKTAFWIYLPVPMRVKVGRA